ncbi:Tpx2, partial [Thalictrum thalictroides]
MTPVKDSQLSRSPIGENTNPNLLNSTPKQKSANSPLIKSAKSKKLGQKSLIQTISPRNKIQDRKFIVAKKKSKVGESQTTSDATCNYKNKMEIAYQNLRASQEDFFKIRRSLDHEKESEELKECERADIQEEEKKEVNKNIKNPNQFDDQFVEDNEYNSFDGLNDYTEKHQASSEKGSSSAIKRQRAEMLEEARNSMPEAGRGKVMFLVQAFEKLNTIPSKKESKESEEVEKDENNKEMKWALPGMQAPRASETQGSLSSFSPSELFFTLDNFGMDSRVSSSLDSSRGSHSSRTSGGGRRSRRNSSESTGTFGGSKWKKKQLKITRQQPFKLRTELRGQSKQDEFLKRVQEMSMEEEKLRIPVAQGLPWTTDEPECLLKPPVKESTRPIDLKLHSDVRAVERADFDNYVSVKLSLIEQYKLEKERQQKLAEEEEVKRLRRELVPRAQPMPYFDRPFVPQ